jgi:hypothetical protein
MHDLTLEQVRAAGRFAYQLTGGDEVPVFNPNTGELAEIVPWEGVASYGSHSWQSEDDAANGWHHLSACNCEFCQP